MGEETQEVPKWLKELEEKREKRLKVRLGHEAGAGSPCLACEDKCPGLDLHFWRKICKNCKCGKEDHDVNDDDMYGWAQFQLLGSKPNKSKKFILPGRKDAVELEWTPRGQSEAVESYLQDLPVNCLPIKGSQAAQQRKQLLQKQIPLHDIDPTLCDALSEDEIKKMNDYIAHVKQSSVGIGHIMKLNEVIQMSRAPMQVPQLESIVLQGVDRANALKAQTQTDISKPLQNLSLDEKFVRDVPESEQTAYIPSNIRNIVYDMQENDPQLRAKNLQVPKQPIVNQIDYQAATNIAGVRDIKCPYNYTNPLPFKQENFNNEHGNVNLDPNAKENLQNLLHGALDSNSELISNTGYLGASSNLPHYAPGKFNTFVEQQSPHKIGNIKDLAYSTYNTPAMNSLDDYNQNTPNFSTKSPNPVKTMNARQNQAMPVNYNPTELNIMEQNVNPVSVNVGIINDVEYPIIKTALEQQDNYFKPELPRKNVHFNITPEEILPACHKCKKKFDPTSVVIGIDHTDALWHSECFKCNGCNQNLADLMYFYHKESNEIYCGRDYAKIRGIPRCQACDELIFVKEYCLAEDSTFHVKHFCCFECDKPLAGQNYVIEDTQPVCLTCFENYKAEKCAMCRLPIKPDEPGLHLNNEAHFHADDKCFSCIMCKKALLGGKFLFKNKNLYCSTPCFSAHKSVGV